MQEHKNNNPMIDQTTQEEIKELKSNYTPLKLPNIPSDLELKEEQYQTELNDFNLLRPNVAEKVYLKDRIKDLKKTVKTLNKTVDKYVSEEIDGKELIDGTLIITKTGTGSDYYYYLTELNFLIDKLQQLIQPKEIEVVGKEKKDEKTFLTGLKFATGEAQELYKKSKISFKKLAIDLGFKDTDRPYFSATLNNNKGIKNLYKNTKVVIQIHDYCIENKIVMCDEFLSKYDQIEPE
jgi:hypothetical protein